MASPRVTESGDSKFSIRLKQLRLDKGYSQKDVADIVGLHSIHYGRYERGDSLPAAETLTKLADALGVSVDYLLEGKNEEAAVAKFEDKELLGMFAEIEKFSPEEKAHIKYMLDNAIKNKRHAAVSAAS